MSQLQEQADLTLQDIDPRQFYRLLLDRIAEGVYFVDTNRRICYWNAAAQRITGFSPGQVMGFSCADNLLVHVDENGRSMCRDGCPLTATLHDGATREAGVFLHHRNGYRLPVKVHVAALTDRHGRIIGAVETFTDNSSRVSDLERIRKLEEIAFLDPLTGLANRRYLDNAIESRFAEAARHECKFGLILADVDLFKRFNDEHGHDTGDRVLQMIAQTFAHNCRAYDVVGRWGGEEFLVVAAHSDVEELRQLAERLRTMVSESRLDVEGRQLSVTASFGIAAARLEDTAATLLKRADAMLYRSKSGGRNCVSCDE